MEEVRRGLAELSRLRRQGVALAAVEDLIPQVLEVVATNLETVKPEGRERPLGLAAVQTADSRAVQGQGWSRLAVSQSLAVVSQPHLLPGADSAPQRSARTPLGVAGQPIQAVAELVATALGSVMRRQLPQPPSQDSLVRLRRARVLPVVGPRVRVAVK